MSDSLIGEPLRLPGGDPTVRPGAFGDPESVWPFFELLWRRRWLILGILILTIVTVGVLTKRAPKTYTTHAEILAGSSGGTQGTDETSLPVLNALLAASNTQSSETYVEMLRGTPVVSRAIADVHLRATPSELLSRVAVKSLPATSIVDLAVTWSDPVTSARIANSLAAAIASFRRDLVAGQADAVVAQLDHQIPVASQGMRAASDKLSDYQARFGIADISAQTQGAIAASTALDQKAAQAQVDAQQYAASLRVVEDQLHRTPAVIDGGRSMQPNPVAAQLSLQLAQVDVDLQSALKKYTESHPTVRALRAQRTQIERELAHQPANRTAQTTTVPNPLAQQLSQEAATLRAQVAAAQAQVGALRQQRSALTSHLRELPQQAQRLAKLQSDARMAESVYTALQQKRNDAVIARTTTLSDVTIIEPATAGTASVSPNVMLNLIIGAILGLTIGLAGAVVIDFLDVSVKTEDDIEKQLSLPVLSSIPRLGSGTKPTPTWLQSAMTESVLQLVTAMRYASTREINSVAFTSASPGDGKSTVAMAAAIAYATLTKRALIIDADMRLPSLHSKLSVPNDRGLSDVLVGRAAFRDVVRQTAHPGLDVVTSGTRPPNPASLLQSSAFDAVLDEARRNYAMVIVDATACAAVADASLVCAKVDGTVFVLARNETDIATASKAMRRLRAAGVTNLLGAVLNKAKVSKSEIGAYGVALADGARMLPSPPPR